MYYTCWTEEPSKDGLAVSGIVYWANRTAASHLLGIGIFNNLEKKECKRLSLTN